MPKTLDLTDRDLLLVDPLSIETFLMEVDCNLPVICAETLRAHFEEDLRRIVSDERHMFNLYHGSMLETAKRERGSK